MTLASLQTVRTELHRKQALKSRFPAPQVLDLAEKGAPGNAGAPLPYV
jgi:hypothetical protein